MGRGRNLPTFKIYSYYYSPTEEELLITSCSTRKFINEHPFTARVSLHDPKPIEYPDYVYVCDGCVDDENYRPEVRRKQSYEESMDGL